MISLSSSMLFNEHDPLREEWHFTFTARWHDWTRAFPNLKVFGVPLPWSLSSHPS